MKDFHIVLLQELNMEQRAVNIFAKEQTCQGFNVFWQKDMGNTWIRSVILVGKNIWARSVMTHRDKNSDCCLVELRNFCVGSMYTSGKHDEGVIVAFLAGKQTYGKLIVWAGDWNEDVREDQTHFGTLIQDGWSVAMV
ncbi:MAG: hypothetical protein ACKPKO_44810, partial [Candidatus Fonsibacter sp.]